MDETTTPEQLHALKERIERGEYEVDPRRVADAIVARLLTVLVTAPPRG
jgi:anti-sigma28 factor (negative regulator of flagellin synthesis)